MYRLPHVLKTHRLAFVESILFLIKKNSQKIFLILEEINNKVLDTKTLVLL
jgi:hypothetical protein